MTDVERSKRANRQPNTRGYPAELRLLNILTFRFVQPSSSISLSLAFAALLSFFPFVMCSRMLSSFIINFVLWLPRYCVCVCVPSD